MLIWPVINLFNLRQIKTNPWQEYLPAYRVQDNRI